MSGCDPLTRRYALIGIFVLMTTVPAVAASIPTLSLGPVTVKGSTVTMPLTLSNVAGNVITGIDTYVNINNVSVPPVFGLKMNGANVISATPGRAATDAGKQLQQSGQQYGFLHIAVIGFGTTSIGNGVIADMVFDILGAATSVNESFQLDKLRTTATDQNGSLVTIATSDTSAPAIRQLSVSLAGNGSGSVNSLPPGIACTVGSCSANYYYNSDLSLLPTPATGSMFGVWSGDCAGSGATCGINMSLNHSATVTFVLNKGIRVAGINYETLNNAYNAQNKSAQMLATEYTFVEDFTLNRGIAVSLMGGYDLAFSKRHGYTTINGKLTIMTGGLAADMLIVR